MRDVLFKGVGIIKGIDWHIPFFQTKHVLHDATSVKLATLEEWYLKWYLLMGLQQMGKSSSKTKRLE